jgi:hypothetical protein
MLVYQPHGRYAVHGAVHVLQYKKIVLIKPVPQELLQFIYSFLGARAMTQALRYLTK